MDVSANVDLLISMTVRSAVLLAIAGLAILLMWRASAAQRHLVWSLAVIGVLLLPVLTVVLPAWRVAVPRPAVVSTPQPATVTAPSITPVHPAPPAPAGNTRPESQTITPVAPPVANRAVIPVPAKNSTAPAAVTPVTPTPVEERIHWPVVSWHMVGLLLWLIGAGALAVRWAVNLLRAGRLISNASAADASWQEVAGEIAANLKVSNVAVFISHAAVVPIVIGVLRPCILLPPDAATAPRAPSLTIASGYRSASARAASSS
jgi:beta-lactamase regulating signal transducer with metallopeptidase domain